MDNELLLFDRLEVIKATMEKYGESNFYLSFSGGKDSTVVHHLLDMALPNNRIPRVFMHTGIEYNDVVQFVKELAEHDDRIIMLKPQVKVKQVLESKGYPFKSKQYSQWYGMYVNHKEEFKVMREHIDAHPELLEDYNFIHNLPVGIKWIVKEYYGKRERERNLYKYSGCP